jgi:hypothetical protein
MPFSDEFIQQWEHIIDEVNKTEVPLECIKKVVIRLNDRKQKTINLSTLRRQGLDLDELEVVLTRTLIELGDTVRDVDFVVDVKEYSKSFSISQDNWAKIVTDTLKVDRSKNPALMLVIGEGNKKVRLAVIEWEVFEELRNNGNNS